MLVNVHITALSPLAFAERKPGAQFRESLPYVPGPAIFGALCRLVFSNRSDLADQLKNVRCTNAYPAYEGDEWVRPLPMTATKPKNARDTSIYDALIERVCWERQQPQALIYAPTDEEGRPHEAVGRAFYTLESGRLAKREVFQRVLTRVAINRRRGTAEEGRLYSPLVLSETTAGKPTQFLGQANLPDEFLSLLAAIEYIGGRQSTGLGAVNVTWQSHVEEQSIAERIGDLTSRFQTQVALYQQLDGKNWPIAERSIFTVNLISDAILFEHGWLPTHQFSSAALREATGIEADLIRSFTSTVTVGGWNVTWQRPKSTATATMMGSVFVFQAKQPLDEAAYTALGRLEQNGIGERRQEGYGQVRICDELHLLERNMYVDA